MLVTCGSMNSTEILESDWKVHANSNRIRRQDDERRQVLSLIHSGVQRDAIVVDELALRVRDGMSAQATI